MNSDKSEKLTWTEQHTYAAIYELHFNFPRVINAPSRAYMALKYTRTTCHSQPSDSGYITSDLFYLFNPSN